MPDDKVPRKGPGKGHLRPLSSFPHLTIRCRRCDDIIIDETAWQFANGRWEHVICPLRYDENEV
jgi:hypothetical protein